MRRLMKIYWVVGVACLTLVGCTTTAAKHALSKPAPKERYAGFDADAADASKREAARPDKLNPEDDPQVAVPKLIAQLQKDRTHAVYAEEQLRYWASKQGGDQLVVRQARMLLKHKDIEVRAPALRLVMQFGGDEINGDLVECLADHEYGLRASAFKALKARTRLDYGFDPSGGEVARATAVQSWRQWWQAEQKRLAVKDPSVYEFKPISEPHVERVGDEGSFEVPSKSNKSDKKADNTPVKEKSKAKKPAPSTEDSAEAEQP